jgi:hypothetical protein
MTQITYEFSSLVSDGNVTLQMATLDACRLLLAAAVCAAAGTAAAVWLHDYAPAGDADTAAAASTNYLLRRSSSKCIEHKQKAQEVGARAITAMVPKEERGPSMIFSS